MEHINDIVAGNLKRLREERRLSLDGLAAITGVSKSMLGQIERGDVNPTISTVWKIANGLRISFSELISKPGLDIETISMDDVKPLVEDDGKYRNYPLFPFDDKRRFEIYCIVVEPDGGVEAEPHPRGTEEFLTVFSGKLRIKVDGKEVIVNKFSSAHFRADRPHSYENLEEETCHISMVIYYPEEQ